MNITKLSSEEFNRFNRLLRDEYGLFEDGNPRFRLVFTDDVTEKRLTKFTKDGFELLTPIVVELPKYRQWKQPRYMIEILTPNMGELELSTNSIDYEPFYCFEDKNQEFLPPHWGAAKTIIDAMLEISGVKQAAKYNTTNEEERRALIERVDALEEALYGNETKIGDSLARDSAIGYGPRRRNDSFSPEAKIQRAQQENS